MYYKKETDYLEGKPPLKERSIDLRFFSVVENGKLSSGIYYEFALLPNQNATNNANKENKALYLRTRQINDKDEWVTALSEIL